MAAMIVSMLFLAVNILSTKAQYYGPYDYEYGWGQQRQGAGYYQNGNQNGYHYGYRNQDLYPSQGRYEHNQETYYPERRYETGQDTYYPEGRYRDSQEPNNPEGRYVDSQETNYPEVPRGQRHLESLFQVDRLEEKREASEGTSDTKGCSMLKDPAHRMTKVMMESACEQYKEWGEDMMKSPSWSPTAEQMEWWKSMDKRPNKVIRKEYRSLTDKERTAFHNAVVELKRSTMGGISKYDIFVGFHEASMAPGAHFGPAFLGWHREFLLRFEIALQEIDPSVSLPYWDSSLDNPLGEEATNSIIWTEEFAGNGFGTVTSGPFANFLLRTPVQGNRFLFRNLTNPPSQVRTPPALMSDETTEMVTQAASLRDVTWFVDISFESNHGATHNWVGGVMTELEASPNEPVFFLHHSYIDCLFGRMRDNQRARGVQVQYDYPNDTVALAVGSVQPNGSVIFTTEDSLQYALNEMRPFGPLRNIDALSLAYEQQYECAPSPSCSTARPTCNSPYLFCDVSSEKCVSKLQVGARCGAFSRYSPCYRSECCNGRCQTTCENQNKDTNKVALPVQNKNENEKKPAPNKIPRPPPSRPSTNQQAIPAPKRDPPSRPPKRNQEAIPRFNQQAIPAPKRDPPSRPPKRNQEAIPRFNQQAIPAPRRDPPSRSPQRNPGIPAAPTHAPFIQPEPPTHAPYALPTVPPVPTHRPPPPYYAEEQNLGYSSQRRGYGVDDHQRFQRERTRRFGERN